MNKEQILFILQNLEKRSHMIVGVETLSYRDSLCYLHGVMAGHVLATGVNLERQISKWYQERTSFKAPNMNWFMQFDLEHKESSENDKMKKLIETLISYFESEL